MNYIVVILAVISIVLVFISKLYNLNIIYPTLMIILTIVRDIVSHKLKSKKDKKEGLNIKDIINRNHFFITQ